MGSLIHFWPLNHEWGMKKISNFFSVYFLTSFTYILNHLQLTDRQYYNKNITKNIIKLYLRLSTTDLRSGSCLGLYKTLTKICWSALVDSLVYTEASNPFDSRSQCTCTHTHNRGQNTQAAWAKNTISKNKSQSFPL